MAVGVRQGMCAAPDAATSGRWYRVFMVLCLVTQLFGYGVSKDRSLCGRDMCMLSIWLGGVCLWLGVCFYACVVMMVA